jgi:hypothetical protein
MAEGRGCDNFTATTFHSAEASCSLQEGAAPLPHRHRPKLRLCCRRGPAQLSMRNLPSPLVCTFTDPNTHTHARTRLVATKQASIVFCMRPGKMRVRMNAMLPLIESRTHPPPLPANITYVQNWTNIREKNSTAFLRHYIHAAGAGAPDAAAVALLARPGHTSRQLLPCVCGDWRVSE